MLYKKKYFFSIYKNLIKFGKVKSNYFKLKKIKKKIIKMLNNIFVNCKYYLIKIKFKKGDNSLLGEFGIFFFYNFTLLK